MNKLCIVCALFLCLLPVTTFGQAKMFHRASDDKNKSRYAQPALPYGPKNQEPWYKERVFQKSDFQEQSDFELCRQETENLRQTSQSKALED